MVECDKHFDMPVSKAEISKESKQQAIISNGVFPKHEVHGASNFTSKNTNCVVGDNTPHSEDIEAESLENLRLTLVSKTQRHDIAWRELNIGFEYLIEN